jgi:CO/xanthine dehydrogenase Mo-binding subunit
VEHYKIVAEVLQLPHNKVRVIGSMVGGGFGGKEDISVEIFLALLALKTKRPVKLTYTREESILCHPKRHPYTMQYKIGAKKDGRIRALEATLISDAGAYPHLSPLVLLYSTVDAAGPYHIPNVKIDSYTVLTNNCISSANRGFGAPQVCFAYESLIDELACKLRIDPLKIREINYLKPGQALPCGQEIRNAICLPDTAVQAWEALGEPTRPSKSSSKVGRGIASGMTSYGRTVFHRDTARCYLSLEMDGSLTIRTGGQDIGAGQSSTYCQIASEVLGIPMHNIKIHMADTALTPQAGTTTASRATYMVGNATLLAAEEVKKVLLNKASDMLEIAAEDLATEDEKVIVKGYPKRWRSLREVIAACSEDGLPLHSISLFKAPFRELEKDRFGQVFPDFTFGSHAVEVEVDTETGKVKVLKIASCFDVGKAINPLSVKGQIEGGTIYGLGYALMEDLVVDHGIIKTPTLSEYLIPTSLDIPELTTIFIESGEGLGPFGSKGIGEPPVASVAPAVANAIFNAVGVRITTLPITGEKIFSRIQEGVPEDVTRLGGNTKDTEAGREAI